MVAAVLKKDPSRVSSGELPRRIRRDIGVGDDGPGVRTKRKDWSDRRLMFQSVIHKGDRKLATALYVIFIVFVIYAAYL